MLKLEPQSHGVRESPTGTRTRIITPEGRKTPEGLQCLTAQKESHTHRQATPRDTKESRDLGTMLEGQGGIQH